jgi:hypothetical protein
MFWTDLLSIFRRLDIVLRAIGIWHTCGNTHITAHPLPLFSPPPLISATLPLSNSSLCSTLAKWPFFFSAPASRTYWASHAYQFCQLTNGRAQICIKEATFPSWSSINAHDKRAHIKIEQPAWRHQEEITGPNTSREGYQLDTPRSNRRLYIRRSNCHLHIKRSKFVCDPKRSNIVVTLQKGVILFDTLKSPQHLRSTVVLAAELPACHLPATHLTADCHSQPWCCHLPGP